MTEVQIDPTAAVPGTIFPMPPRPAWATNKTEWGSDGVREHSCNVGDVACFGEGAKNSATVEICRYDLLTESGIVVGETLANISADAVDLTPAGCRELAALLLTTADLLEG